ncbi:MAG TPA: TlpA family protein disulfide reductase [Gammaproteobacteria bacterium]|nr:TlpA family protein disulfide reductase [Gammaproteobacteria bacterium]
MLHIIRFLVPGLLFIASIGSAAEGDVFTAMDVEVPKVRVQAPAITLDRPGGDQTVLTDFAGKVVLLNFWATWCSPCREEMPAMQSLWEKYREQGFVIIAVAADRGKREQVMSFAEKLALTFPIVFDPEGEIRKRYEVVALPMSYLIGRDGKISGRIIGKREWGSGKADEMITALLSQDQ